MHHHDHHSTIPSGNQLGLKGALLITAGIMILEFFGGLLTNSLALLSDAGHMLSDTGALALSLLAMWFASKPPSPGKTYGFYRLEIIAALFNGLALFIIAGIISWEAWQRFWAPPEVNSLPMMLIALTGLVANIVSAWFLHRHGDVKDNMNLKSAYLHVLGDALGSLGAIAAGGAMYIFGWYLADPLISVAVALLILKSAWGIIDDSLHILMEGTPLTVSTEAVKTALTKIDGVQNVHDLHIWTITSGLDSLSCHLLVSSERNSQEILQEAIDLIAAQFKIQHTTIQIETTAFQHPDVHI